MAFRNIYNGGPCSADGQAQSQNPFKQFMNKMIFGQAQQQQIQSQISVTHDQRVNDQIKQRQLQFQQWNNQWNDLAHQFDQATLNDRAQMERVFQEEEQKYMHFLQEQERFMQEQWHQAELQKEADDFAQEFKFNEAYENAANEVEADAKNQTYATDMIEVLMNDPDPKFQQSKFLSLLKQFQSGDIKLQEKQLVDKTGKVVEPPALERYLDLDKKWDGAEQQVEAEQKQKKTLEDIGQEMDALWNKRIEDYEKEAQDEVAFKQKLEEEYKKILEQIDKNNFEDVFSEAWTKASDLQEFELYKDAHDVYQFQPNNPYLAADFPLQIAIDLVNKGQNTEAILALEAHIQKHSQDSNAWRILGRLHQENDQDQRAVAAFLNGIKHNDSDLDTLGALGISCTNILDEVKAMSYLKQWLQKNPKYQMMAAINSQIIPDNATVYDFTIEQIKAMNQQMIDLFQGIFASNQGDVDLMNGLAVLYFIQRDYQKSVEIFKKALNIEPNNYQIWNKLGATLAHLGEADQAIFCYHRALDLRPNYVRVWVNLAFAYSYKGKYEDSARLYLSALHINPQAKHIWGYLQTTFLQLERPDLIQKIQFYDPNVFESDFTITNPIDLPDPELQYREANNKYIFRFPEEVWLQQFKK